MMFPPDPPPEQSVSDLTARKKREGGEERAGNEIKFILYGPLCCSTLSSYNKQKGVMKIKTYPFTLAKIPAFIRLQCCLSNKMIHCY